MIASIDSFGCVINQGDVANIRGVYKSALDELLHSVKSIDYATAGNELHSVYVRGSVAAGTAKPGLSDMDCIIVLRVTPNDEILSGISLIARNLEAKYAPELDEIDVTVTTHAALLYDNQIKNLKVYMKYQSVCIYGKDLTDNLPDVIPGPQLAIYMYDGLELELQSLHDQFQGIATKTYQQRRRENRFWCVWLSRTLLRSAMALAMFRQPVLTQDLLECQSIGSEHFPELSKMLDLAAMYAIKPTDDSETLIKYIDKYMPTYMALWQNERKTYEKIYN